MNKLKSKNGIVSFILFLIVWQILSLNYSSIILPGPLLVLKSFIKMIVDAEIYYDFIITIYRGLLGYFISVILGIILAIIFYTNLVIKEIFYPYVTILQAVPRISWILLAMIWFPLNSYIVIFIIIITIMPIIIINTFEGLENIDLELLDMARIFKVSNKKIIRNIYLPSIISYMASGAKVSLALMWKTVIMAELLTVQTGLGARMGYLRTALATEQILVITCIIIFINLLCQLILNIFIRKIERWKDENVYNKAK